MPVDGPIFNPAIFRHAIDPELPRIQLTYLCDSACEKLDFTMCNPPFYSNHEDVQRSAEGKEYGPNAVCNGSDNEMITAGGEVAFVSRMVGESVQLRTRCR